MKLVVFTYYQIQEDNPPVEFFLSPLSQDLSHVFFTSDFLVFFFFFSFLLLQILNLNEAQQSLKFDFDFLGPKFEPPTVSHLYILTGSSPGIA